MVTSSILSLDRSYAWSGQARRFLAFWVMFGWLHCSFLGWLDFVWLVAYEAGLHYVMQLGMIGCLLGPVANTVALFWVCLPLGLYERQRSSFPNPYGTFSPLTFHHLFSCVRLELSSPPHTEAVSAPWSAMCWVLRVPHEEAQGVAAKKGSSTSLLRPLADPRENQNVRLGKCRCFSP